jgi:hypothetical protein
MFLKFVFCLWKDVDLGGPKTYGTDPTDSHQNPEHSFRRCGFPSGEVEFSSLQQDLQAWYIFCTVAELAKVTKAGRFFQANQLRY